MTTRAYQEIYLNNAQSALGDAFDYAVNDCKIDGSDFFKMFCVSRISARMENGEPAVISGMSGIETAQAVVFETMQKQLDIKPRESFSRSKEYWIGWALAYYQWYSDRKYIEILNAVSYAELEKMYYTLHEADISKFADIIDRRIRERYPETKLKRFRTLYGITQSELADSAGVSLRSIQMYEQRKKDINKAGAQTLYKISKVLGCTIEDLLEK